MHALFSLHVWSIAKCFLPETNNSIGLVDGKDLQTCYWHTTNKNSTELYFSCK